MKRWIIGTATGVVVLLVSALILTGPATAQADYSSVDKAVASSNELTADAARTAVEGYLADNGLDALDVGAVVTFSNHTYVAAIDPATGQGAVELIVDADGTVHHQPTLIWNTTYHSVLAGPTEMAQHGMSGMHGSADAASGMGSMMNGMSGMHGSADGASGMGSMMNGGQHGQMHGGRGTMPHEGAGMMNHDRLHAMDGSGTGVADQDRLRMMNPAECQQFATPADPTTTLAEPLNADTAVTAAQDWLDANQPGAKVGQITTFPGYFTVEATDAGQVTGFISVQATTGLVLSQTWHGNIVSTS